MCTEHHRIYGHVLSAFGNFRLSATFSDSSRSTLVHQLAPIDPVTNLNPVLVNTASAPLHTLSDHMSDHQCLGLSPCPVLTARLAAITASSLCCPGRVSRVANPHHSNPYCREPPVITGRCRVSRLHQTIGPQSDPRVSRYPAEIGFDSLLTYAVAPPSAQSIVIHQTPAPPST